MTGEEILFIEMDSLMFDLAAKHEELGMKASGEWLKALKNKTKAFTGLITGNDYTEYLVNGRKPGKFPPYTPGKGFVEIEKWIKDKGLINKIRGSLTISSLAFLIARKIANEGTKYFQDGGTELISSVITPERIQRIIDKVSKFKVNEFVSDITNAFKEFAPA